ncbi:MAG: hypothetical protein LJF15_12595 [Acidobacteria bacterium]|jgi:hypothetical protein|nr:hypothetical protein [Acidobacteriota bacterium]
MTSEGPAHEGSKGGGPAARRLLQWARLSRSWGELAGVAAVVLAGAVVFLILSGGPSSPRTPTAAIAPGMAHRLMSLPLRVSMPASLDLAGSRPGTQAVREEGAGVGLSFRIEGRARALVLEDRAGVRTVQLYPIAGRPADPIPAGRRIEVTDPAGGPLVIVEPRGTRRVRLFVFPENVDPLSLQPTELVRVESRLTIIERTYWAGRRGEGSR